jgi:hypothetical protein
MNLWNIWYLCTQILPVSVLFNGGTNCKDYITWMGDEWKASIYNNITIFIGKPKYLQNDLFKCHFVYNKSHLDFPGIKLRTAGQELTAWTWPKILVTYESAITVTCTEHKNWNETHLLYKHTNNCTIITYSDVQKSNPITGLGRP